MGDDGRSPSLGPCCSPAAWFCASAKRRAIRRSCKEDANNPPLGRHELAISLDGFRSRHRDSFSDPSPIPAGKVQEYKFRLPTVNHVFQPGHRIMVQVQSSLFPVYDRNPQTYVPNIFFAKKADDRPATVTLERGGATPSRVLLPVVPVDQSAAGAH